VRLLLEECKSILCWKANF